MRNLKFKDRSPFHARLAIYDARLRAEGRLYPPHPKNGDSLHLTRVAIEADIPMWMLRDDGTVANQLAKLSADRIADPCALRHAAAANRLEAIFRDRPLPRRFRSYHKSQIAHEAELSVRDLDDPVCKSVLRKLQIKNGLADVVCDIEADRAAISTYVKELERKGAKFPVNPWTGTVHVSKVAKATDIIASRLYQEPLKTELQIIAGVVGVDAVETIAVQARRLERFVDDAIKGGMKMPGANGTPRFAEIAKMTAIPPHRLRSAQMMAAQLRRWNEACGPRPSSRGSRADER